MTSSWFKAARSGDVETIKELVESGAEIEAKYILGWTALHFASDMGHLEVVKYLLENGAEIEAKDNFGAIALSVASSNGHLEVVKYLLESGAEIEAIDNDGLTALHYAEGENQVLIKNYKYLNDLTEWRPWNHSKYPSEYRKVMCTLVILAKAIVYKSDDI